MKKQDFQFEFVGHGHYKVIYTSPVTGKQWSKMTSDMELIDLTKNEETPTKTNLNILKRLAKL